MKAIVIGRHQNQIEGIEVVESRNITFTSAEQSREIAIALLEEALQKEVVILFQNVPAIAATAICKTYWNGRAGIIISKPGKRESITEKIYCEDEREAKDTVALARMVNPNVKTAIEADYTVVITVDQPMVFEFSYIEWL